MDIRIENVVMKYGPREVLNIDHLHFKQGKSYGLVGHNGAGKTTLFKCITNIITTYTGEILIGERNVKEDNTVLLNVGIVLDGMSVYQDHTGWFNIRYFSGLKGEDKEEEAMALAKELSIDEVLDQRVATYSYGMQKKLILLIALLHSPEILILDEPFRGLDMETVDWFKAYLGELKDNGQMLLISSHVQNDLESLCDVVKVIEQGIIKEDIDLEVEKQRQFRIIDTSDNDRVREIMKEVGLEYMINRQGIIKVDVADELWEDVYQHIQEEEIVIYEMSRVKILDDKLN